MKTWDHCDLNITTMCNFSCQSCSHASPISGKYFMSTETMVHDLLAAKPFMRFRNLQFVGGEPTIHPKIVEMLLWAAQVGISSDVMVITNGSRLPHMPDEFYRAIGFLQISQYAKLPQENIDFALEKSKQFGFGIGITKFTDFYLQLKPAPDDGVESFKNCPWKNNDCHTIHEGHYYRCPQSAFFPKLLQSLPQDIDGLPLEGLTDEKLDEYINRSAPFNACRICTGGHGKTQPWSESDRKNWIANSTLK